jgi:hypothetical protein
VKHVVDKFGRQFKNSIENKSNPLLCSMYIMVHKDNNIESPGDHLLQYNKNKGNEVVTIKSYGHLQSLVLTYVKYNEKMSSFVKNCTYYVGKRLLCPPSMVYYSIER